MKKMLIIAMGFLLCYLDAEARRYRPRFSLFSVNAPYIPSSSYDFAYGNQISKIKNSDRKDQENGFAEWRINYDFSKFLTTQVAVGTDFKTGLNISDGDNIKSLDFGDTLRLGLSLHINIINTKKWNVYAKGTGQINVLGDETSNGFGFSGFAYGAGVAYGLTDGVMVGAEFTKNNYGYDFSDNFDTTADDYEGYSAIAFLRFQRAKKK